MKVLIKYLTILCVTITVAKGQTLSWNDAGEMRFPVTGASAFSFGDVIFLTGGYSGEVQSNVDWLQKFNTSQGIWKIVGNMNYERFGLYSARIGETAYIFGGVGELSNNANYLETWEYIGTALSVIADSNSQFDRILTTGNVVNSKIYLIGGNSFAAGDSLDLDYLIEYDPSINLITFSDTSFSGDDLPEQQMAAAIGNDIFIFGGVVNGITNKIYKFNTISKTLDQLSLTLLSPRAAGAAVYLQSQDCIYIFGGYDENNLSLNTSEIFMIKGQDYSIETGPAMQYARKNLSGIEADGKIYAMGGTNDDGEIVPYVEVLTESVVSVEDFEIPSEYELYQNYPNPFNPITKIKFSIPTVETGHAPSLHTKLDVYDILGEQVSTLIDDQKSPGTYEVEFDASNLPSGIYFYKLDVYSNSGTTHFSDTKKMVLIK